VNSIWIKFQSMKASSLIVQRSYRCYKSRELMVVLKEQEASRLEELARREAIEEGERARQEAIEEEERAKQEAVEEEERARRIAIEEEEQARRIAIEEEERARREAIEEEELANQRAIEEEKRAQQLAIEEEEHGQKIVLEEESATNIQTFFRASSNRISYGKRRSSIVRLQAVVRGKVRRLADRRELEERRGARLSPPYTPPPGQEDAEEFLDASNAEEVLLRDVPQVGGDSVSLTSAIVPVETGDPEMVHEVEDMYKFIELEQWAKVENLLDRRPELSEKVKHETGELPLHIIAQHVGAWTLLIDMVLVLHPKALIHRDERGALPIHHAAAHDNYSGLEIIYSAYKEGINEVDAQGRMPIHVAAEFDAVDAVKFLLAKSPEGAYTMVHRPSCNTGGGLPLHIACRNYASIGVITALLAENFSSAKRSDENGDLPLHLLLRSGDVVDQVIVKTLLTCFSAAVSRTDMNGDLPLAISLKNNCKAAVINTLLIQFPDAAGILNGDGHSPLHLAFENGYDDRTILGLLNHAPELATTPDRETALMPIQVATQHEHSPFIIHNLLKRDMPIDLKEKVRAQLLPHHYSWNHIASSTNDVYHMVVSKLLQQCTQPQVLALAHVEDTEGKIALASATPVCKHELRVMLRLFNTLEVVNQRPAYTNPASDTQIFYALRYDPPSQHSSAFTVLHEDKADDTLGDYVEEWDDSSYVSALSKNSARSTVSNRSHQSIEEKLRCIRKERGQQVIAKLTSRSDIVERELKVRKEYHLSRHYVPAIISVHHTVQHAAYSEAMAEPGYCITMEGADTTAENLMLDLRKHRQPFPPKALKRIGISLLHMHEHGVVHGDFGTHNIGKFGSRWKLLGVGGSIPIGEKTSPSRGFYHPPESIHVETKRASLGKKTLYSEAVAIDAHPTYDTWGYGIVLYEAFAGVPLSPYACRGKRPMTHAEMAKIGKWDDYSLRKALKHLDPTTDDDVKDLMKRLLHPNPLHRINSMKQVLDHVYFTKQQPSAKNGSSKDVANSVSSAIVSHSSSVKKYSSSPSVKRVPSDQRPLLPSVSTARSTNTKITSKSNTQPANTQSTYTKSTSATSTYTKSSGATSTVKTTGSKSGSHAFTKSTNKSGTASTMERSRYTSSTNSSTTQRSNSPLDLENVVNGSNATPASSSADRGPVNKLQSFGTNPSTLTTPSLPPVSSNTPSKKSSTFRYVKNTLKSKRKNNPALTSN